MLSIVSAIASGISVVGTLTSTIVTNVRINKMKRTVMSHQLQLDIVELGLIVDTSIKLINGVKKNNAMVNDLDAHLAKIDASINMLMAENITNQKQAVENKNYINDLDSRVSKAEDTVKNLLDEREIVNNKLESTETRIREYNKNVTKLEIKTSELTNAIDSIELKVDHNTNKNKEPANNDDS